MNPAYISALSALFGSAIGAFASLATTWLTQRHQDEVRQRAQVNIRRERVFVEFIDLSSKAFVDALQRTSIQDTSQIMPLYATMGKLRLFASARTIEAAERVKGTRFWEVAEDLLTSIEAAAGALERARRDRDRPGSEGSTPG
jgi:hypothetical protein